MKYIKELDSLRAIAVILVIIEHWIPGDKLINILPNGQIGVDIFFVLSGFLISKILFENKIAIESGVVSKTNVLKNFYIRRTLRIFPIYYLLIFTLYIFSENTGTNITSSFPYFFTYTSNFYFFQIKEWDAALSHLWSLAVEEQFYLIWPWIILLVKKKYLVNVILSFILIGVSSQIFLYNIEMNRILTITCFDAFGMGALLAWLITYSDENLNRFFNYLSIISLAVIGYLFLFRIFNWNYLPVRTIVAIFTLFAITYILINQNKKNYLFYFILNNNILIFLGKISYGLYLYHNIVPSILNSRIVNKYFNPLLPDLLFKENWGLLYLFENIILLLILAWASFRFIEKPILSLKKHFEYKYSETSSVKLKNKIQF